MSTQGWTLVSFAVNLRMTRFRCFSSACSRVLLSILETKVIYVVMLQDPLVAVCDDASFYDRPV